MFLSTQQLDLIEHAYKAPVDILNCNVRTVCALSARGLTEVIYAKNVNDVTRVLLTPAGYMIGGDINRYRLLPTFQEVMKDLVPHKKSIWRSTRASRRSHQSSSRVPRNRRHAV
jgi:hypothetical protein